MTKLYLQFICGDDAGTEKLCRDGNKSCKDRAGMGTRSGMWRVLLGRVGDGE